MLELARALVFMRLGAKLIFPKIAATLRAGQYSRLLAY